MCLYEYNATGNNQRIELIDKVRNTCDVSLKITMCTASHLPAHTNSHLHLHAHTWRADKHRNFSIPFEVRLH